MTQTPLFTPYPLTKTLTLKNRIVMAPMTRAMADETQSPTAQSAAYYARRANAGLIVTEGTVINPMASGYKNVPGIYTPHQIAQWRKVTEAVHQNDGKIFQQIWHVGRVSHPNFLNGELPVSASATLMKEPIPRSNGLFYGKCRALTRDEITLLIQDYKQAAINAIAAGFDGVELHGANGYLIDQFLHHCTNLRDDEYGQTPENMSRFTLEVVKACGEAIGFDRLAIRLSPGAYLNEIVGDARDAAVFAYLFSQLNTLNLAYVHTGNFNDTVKFNELGESTMSNFIRKHYQGNLIAAGSYTPERAANGLEHKQFDLVAFGRPFLANPDYVEKLKQQTPLVAYEPSMLTTLY